MDGNVVTSLVCGLVARLLPIWHGSSRATLPKAIANFPADPSAYAALFVMAFGFGLIMWMRWRCFYGGAFLSYICRFVFSASDGAINWELPHGNSDIN